MVIIAKFTVEAETFPLGTVFTQLPAAEVELERVVPTNLALIPYFWVRGAQSDDIVAGFGERPEVKRIELVDEINDEYLLRVEWDSEEKGLLKAIAETPVALLSAVGTSEEWCFEFRADEAHDISDFQDRCWEYDVPVELVSLHTVAPIRSGAEYDLTETQHEALILAYEQGFYQSPREITLSELADQLGITGQSLGSRLRRGTHRLIGSTLIGPMAGE